MPELPEVQTIVDMLRPRLLGRRIAAVRLARKDILTPPSIDLARLLMNRTLHALDRRGKRIIFLLEDGSRFYIHLGMTGRLAIEPMESPPQPHTHLEISLDDGTDVLRFRDPRRFGGIWWLGRDAAADAGMGPEPLTMRAGELAARLARARRPLKSALLDQKLIAGLGNIYVDEALFLAKLHPLRFASDLSSTEASSLSRAIKATLRKAIGHRGSTLRDYFDAEGKPGAFQKLHNVYGRTDLPCRKCKALLQRIVVGGRSTHFCPKCQP